MDFLYLVVECPTVLNNYLIKFFIFEQGCCVELFCNYNRPTITSRDNFVETLDRDVNYFHIASCFLVPELTFQFTQICLIIQDQP